MATINVQFSDATESTIIGYSACRQPDDTWPHQGEIATSDSRWSTYFASKDTESQRGLPIPASE
ncbi:hypothetical protein WJ61_30640 [Burkholderia ubonensis]|uniref:hypothetical protein n=1 Tax=Burkholderia ubonensis TaxID=101571 RepID=UPI00075B3079|nr:hypothetical protein [Burkholderia ubonensis]KVM66026.1 hypothetical protein WJ61_30640 [Burkholderia ubonensis]